MISRDIKLAKKAKPMDRTRKPKQIDWKRRLQERISDTEDTNLIHNYRKWKRVQHRLDEASKTELPE
jgi:hypothetical protein